jgi:hypothetical protein
MAALTKDRNTEMEAIGLLNNMPVAASTVIFKGSLIGASATGFLVPGAASVTILGIAQFGVDNSSGADGAEDCTYQTGIAHLEPGTVTAAERGLTVSVLDDQTLATGTANPAGKFLGFDDDTGEARLHIL